VEEIQGCGVIPVLTILACFTGSFAFAFGTAGVVGLMDFERKGRRAAILTIVDHLAAGGLFSAGRDISENWQHRPFERRLLLLGLAWGIICLALPIVIR